MKKVNELEIKITKALITSISIDLDAQNNIPNFTVSGQLITEQGQAISSFSFATNHWKEDSTINVPMTIHNPAREIFELLTPVIYEKINGVFPKLSAQSTQDDTK